MTFDGEEFFLVGKHLETYSKEEAYQRTAVGRFYYACYLIAREIYNSRHNRKMGSRISHYDLIKYFKDSDDESRNIGDKLEILRSKRNDADYEVHFDGENIEDSKEISEELLDYFKKEIN